MVQQLNKVFTYGTIAPFEETRRENCWTMQNTLILTGWGWKEYSVAAASALRALKGMADVRGVSKRRLPEMLEELPPNYKKVVIVGVALGGDPARIENALKRLKKRNVAVCRISAFPMEEPLQKTLSGLIDERVVDSSLLEAVGTVFKMDVADLEPYASESKRVSGAVKAFHELVAAAMYAYRNYQEEEAYEKAIACLANRIAETSWPVEGDCVLPCSWMPCSLVQNPYPPCGTVWTNRVTRGSCGPASTSPHLTEEETVCEHNVPSSESTTFQP